MDILQLNEGIFNELTAGLGNFSNILESFNFLDFASSIRYAGFNVEEWRANILRMTAAHTRYNQLLHQSIQLLIAGGSNLKRLKHNIEINQKFAVRDVKKYFHLKSSGKLADNNTLTLPRIAACFPEIYCKYMNELKQTIINLEPILAGADIRTQTFPTCLIKSNFLSIWPSTENPRNTMMVALFFSYKLDELIGKKDIAWEKPEKLEQLHIYLVKARDSNIFDNGKRYEITEELGGVALFNECINKLADYVNGLDKIFLETVIKLE